MRAARAGTVGSCGPPRRSERIMAGRREFGAVRFEGDERGVSLELQDFFRPNRCVAVEPGSHRLSHQRVARRSRLASQLV